MKRAIYFLALTALPTIFSCAGITASKWSPYVFDGNRFSIATSNTAAAIWVRNGHLPAASDVQPDPTATPPLPKGTGAVAGICYLQSTGGKSSAQSHFIPYANEQVTFKGKTDGVSVAITDKNGYFLNHLHKGDYELFCRGIKREFTIREGETTFVPIRGGKRMAD
ncbi:MAG: hypothetical protein HXX17_03995 [Geobacteraceae bacterium]|nr:hypothetical protein [Geobacteraceae bacterium]